MEHVILGMVGSQRGFPLRMVMNAKILDTLAIVWVLNLHGAGGKVVAEIPAGAVPEPVLRLRPFWA